jgi:hypothetical protein
MSMSEQIEQIKRWDDSPVVEKLATLMALLDGEHPAKVYTPEGYDVWLRGVASQLTAVVEAETNRLDALSVAQADYITFLAEIVTDHEKLLWVRTGVMATEDKRAEGKRLRAAIYAAGGRISTATDNPSAYPQNHADG